MFLKLTIISGILTGGAVKVLTGDLGMAIFTALCTGAAAYAGQQLAKYIHKKIKR